MLQDEWILVRTAIAADAIGCATNGEGRIEQHAILQSNWPAHVDLRVEA